MPGQCTAATFPRPPARVFLVGIGGIGMSGLAQYLVERGYHVAGSDRLLDGPGRTELMNALRALGITIFPQDGSGPRTTRPEAMIASAAVEAGNPDFEAAPHVARCARAEALATLLNRDKAPQIAIAGSAGKTSVTAWLASALRALGKRVLVVDGGYMIDAQSQNRPGNFSADPNPDFLVVEVDESDKSLLAFSPDVGVLLNIGTDHYAEAELAEVFGHYLDRCTKGCVIPTSLMDILGQHGPEHQVHFSDCLDAASAGKSTAAASFKANEQGCTFLLSSIGPVRCSQFGRHSATNAAAVVAAIRAAGLTPSPNDLRRALASFRGVRERFERSGTSAAGQPVYRDYAHNVQKIAAAIDTARQAVQGALLVFFQPHGFGPLAFMEESLAESLQRLLIPSDLFVFLPVYYAGGTTSFEPTSSTVAAVCRDAGLPVMAVESRQAAVTLATRLAAVKAILVLGARDPSLPSFAEGLCSKGSPVTPGTRHMRMDGNGTEFK